MSFYFEMDFDRGDMEVYEELYETFDDMVRQGIYGLFGNYDGESDVVSYVDMWVESVEDRVFIDEENVRGMVDVFEDWREYVNREFREVLSLLEDYRGILSDYEMVPM